MEYLKNRQSWIHLLRVLLWSKVALIHHRQKPDMKTKAVTRWVSHGEICSPSSQIGCITHDNIYGATADIEGCHRKYRAALGTCWSLPGICHPFISFHMGGHLYIFYKKTPLILNAFSRNVRAKNWVWLIKRQALHIFQPHNRRVMGW